MYGNIYTLTPWHHPNSSAYMAYRERLGNVVWEGRNWMKLVTVGRSRYVSIHTHNMSGRLLRRMRGTSHPQQFSPPGSARLWAEIGCKKREQKQAVIENQQ